MKKYVKPAQQIYNINTCNHILSTSTIKGEYSGQELRSREYDEEFSSMFEEGSPWGRGF